MSLSQRQILLLLGEEEQTSMDDVNPSEESRHTPPNLSSFPPEYSPSPSTSTPPFLLKTSSIVVTSSSTLLLQDYRKTHRQEQAFSSVAVVLRQSLQNQASTLNFHPSQPPNLQPSSPQSPPLVPPVSQAPTQFLALGWHCQDQIGHWNKETALIQHRPASVAISESNPHDPPLLRPLAAFRSPPKSSLSALPASALNAPRSQHRQFPTAEVLSLLLNPLALNVFHDPGASLQLLNPNRSLHSSRLFTPGCDRHYYSDPTNRDSQFEDMAPFAGLFKRPRSKSEMQLRSSYAAHPSEGPVQVPTTPRQVPTTPRQMPTTPRQEPLKSSSPILPWTPVDVPELPAEWGPFYEAGHGNPYSPLRKASARPPVPPGPPQISEEEIGTKFPSLSNGPGIERRIFIDPTRDRRQYVAKPESSHTPRRSVSLDRLTPSRTRHYIHHREEPIARSPRFLFPDKAIEAEAEDRTVGSIEIDPRLSQWAWSPQNSASGSLISPESSTFEMEVFGRLRDSSVHVDPGPGSLQSSSSANAAQRGPIRCGTPPLLFGSRAIGTSREDDDRDWETVANSNGRSRGKLHDVEATAGTGSSIADVSDSSNLSAMRGVATELVILHPPHPRYQHAWTMLQDTQSGTTVLTPEYSGVSAAPSQDNAAIYQHPRRLSPTHQNPFHTSPPIIRPSPRVAYNLGEIPPPLPLRNPRRLRPHAVTEDVAERNLTHVDDGEWLSTTEGAASLNEGEGVPERKGSFAKVTIIGGRANVTGTPEGTGAREVGSSLADASSPMNRSESPGSKTKVIQHRRTIDGSLDSVEANAPDNFYNRIHNRPIIQTDSDDEEFEQDFESTPPGNLSPEIRQHRQQLIDHSLLPRLPTPPFTEPKRISVPDHLLRSATSVNMENEQETVFADGAASIHMARTRGPVTMPAEASTANVGPAPTTTPPRPAAARARPHAGPYDDFIRNNRGPAEQRGRVHAADRPAARAESPHLHRLPRPTGPAIQRREKVLSRVVFAVMCIFPPTLLFYGHGLMDGLMSVMSVGQIAAFRKTEKKVALWVGWMTTVAIFAGAIYAIAMH